MKATIRDNQLATALTVTAAVIFVLLPFQALITTWPGSVFGHLDLFRIWKEILISLMAVPAFWLAWRTPPIKKWLASSWLSRLIYFYFGLHFVLGWWALANHQVAAVALIYGLIVNLRFLAFFLICLVTASRSDWLARHWARLTLWPATVVVAFGLAQRFILPFDFLRHFGYGPNTLPAYQTVDANIDYRRIQSTLRGANPLGAYLSLIIPTLFVQVAPWLKKLLFAIAATVVLFYSYSRSAWIGTLIALTAIVWKTRGRGLKHKWLVVTAGLAVILAAGGYTLRANQTFQDTFLHTSPSSRSPQSSNSQRLTALKTASQDIIHQPLGRGPGTAGPASSRNNHPPRIAENYYLQLGQEVGVVGMVAFVAINGLVAVELWRRRNDHLPLVLLATLAGVTFINLLSHAWTDDSLSLIWWGLAGIALAPAILSIKVKHASKTT